MVRKAIKALKRIAGKSNDETLMSYEDFKNRVKNVAKGEAKSFANTEDIDKYVRSL